jgi:hypothetical protein
MEEYAKLAVLRTALRFATLDTRELLHQEYESLQAAEDIPPIRANGKMPRLDPSPTSSEPFRLTEPRPLHPSLFSVANGDGHNAPAADSPTSHPPTTTRYAWSRLKQRPRVNLSSG